eukprot:TRINITY_DN14837_c0_g1::TRINITY_DN14837_c0_g1_i1::g.16279::m.16279 TRINITY_DN14837_c0_g1::TRINITY_DN14837_c0_g1_i1::g.16279  ORF type:complete len:318 (+),score=31.12,DUF3456/PF11938.3/1.5e-05,MT0933_antitox/PF14013.1/1.5e+04,MT0933_antitox/PF14013.1/0.055,Antimicrobial_2/PF08023.7/1.1e+04,Antimicrobial_2/PF08023.7/0.22,CAP18_C/PF12153.3/4.2e+03,CAP18_C/PF12153.3/0.35 TRINITY_DN14837_c0_g1_i1:3-956(+)
MKSLLFIAFSLIFLSFISIAFANAPEKKAPVNEEVPHILCQVCEEASKNIHRLAQTLKTEKPKGKKIGEEDLIDLVDKACDPDTDQGQWIRHFDIQSDENSLKLTENEYPGRCGRECRTIAKACRTIIDDHDTELGELLWSGAQRAQISNNLCHKLTKACKKTNLKPLKTRKDEEFEPLSDEDLQMEKLMAQMAQFGGMGMPGGMGMDEEYGMDEYDMAGYDMEGYAPSSHQEPELVQPASTTTEEESEPTLLDKAGQKLGEGLVKTGGLVGSLLDKATDSLSGLMDTVKQAAKTLATGDSDLDAPESVKEAAKNEL